nr:MAG TPA: hypothetical protein [Caudoviricetes sp.]
MMILDQIRTAKDGVRIGIYQDYDELSAAKRDDPFKKMFYELNDMCILISDMLKEGESHD